MGLSTVVTAIGWTGFSVFTIGWVFVGAVAIIAAFMGWGRRRGEGDQKTDVDRRGSTFGTRGTIVTFVLAIVLWMAVAFMYLSFVAENNEKDIFILRAGEDPIMGGCDQSLVNSGTCAFLIRPMWYVVIFVIFAFLYAHVFYLTPLTTAMFVLGTITLAFGVEFATYTGNDNSAWTSWALAVVGSLWAIGWATYAFFDATSASIFVGYINLTGTKAREARGIQRIQGQFAEGTIYSQFMNPFAWDWVYLLHLIVVAVLYLWYVIAWVLGPASTEKQWNFDVDIGIHLGTDIVLFAVLVLVMLVVWYFYDPGTYRIGYGRNVINQRRKEIHDMLYPNLQSEENLAYLKYPDPRGSIRQVRSKHPKKSSATKPLNHAQRKSTTLILN